MQGTSTIIKNMSQLSISRYRLLNEPPAPCSIVLQFIRVNDNICLRTLGFTKEQVSKLKDRLPIINLELRLAPNNFRLSGDGDPLLSLGPKTLSSYFLLLLISLDDEGLRSPVERNQNDNLYLMVRHCKPMLHIPLQICHRLRIAGLDDHGWP